MQVAQAGRARLGYLGRELAGELVADPVLDAEHPARSREHLGAVALEPGEQRDGLRRPGRLAGHRVDGALDARLGELRADAVRALVGGDDGRIAGLALRVDEAEAVAVAREADAGDLIAGDARALKRLAHRLGVLLPHLVRIALGPAGLGDLDRKAPARDRKLAPVGGKDRAFDLGAAVVDADEILLRHGATSRRGAYRVLRYS